MSEDYSLFDDDQPDDLADIELPPRLAKKKRKAFKVEWVKLPRQWADALRQSKSVATYQLAILILFEAFKRKHTGGEIILSSKMTGMPKSTRIRAAKELVELGLVKLHRQSDGQAHRILVYEYKKRTKNKN